MEEKGSGFFVLKMKVLISDNSLSFDEIFERVLG
jgi:hypothetical protein